MKRTILILFVTLSSLSTVIAQTTKKDFVGHWASNGTSTQCVIFLDKYDKLQYVEWDKSDGQDLEVLSLRYEKNTLFVRTRFKENNWIVTSELTLIDEFNMKAKIVGDANTTIQYKKLK
jgi:hypothetical protein